jgi:N-acetylglucosaminyldiphosphoundecaprenol N-acetyl-beta-D-mannosaminyltransferase
MIDADSVADPDVLLHLEEALAGGAEVAQADYRILEPEATPGSRLVATGFLLFHRTRLAGRAALGLPANLLGNGMAFKREVFQRVPWTAFTSVEDLEYSLVLRAAGVRPVFVANALVEGPVPQGRKALQRQRMRWEGGRLFMISRWLRPLLGSALRRRDWSLLDAAADLAILPTGLLALAVILGSAVAGMALSTHAVSAWVAVPWVLSIVTLAAYVLVGLRAAGAPPSVYRDLLAVPGFLLRKVFLYARMLTGLNPYRWEAAGRDGSSDQLHDPDGDGRAWVAGVPVDVVDIGGAVKRVMDLVGRPGGAQICTVNLDFVVSAQRDAEISGLLRSSDLNVADGAPVAWLARLARHRMPRVAGADLVPLVAGAAAKRGASLFFLGGEQNAAEEAARRLRARYPSLKIAGCYEPPRARVEDLPSAEMVRLVRESGAAIVLVGLGHPKQERWIALHRAELGSSVSIGVGGCFDFISARRRRAPRWIQNIGLEWLYRLSQEPRRLFTRYARDAGWLLMLGARAIRNRRRLTEGAIPAG